jgi:hypothetical protein
MPQFTIYEYVWDLERRNHEITAKSLTEALALFHDGDTDPGYSEVIVTMQDSTELEVDDEHRGGGPVPGLHRRLPRLRSQGLVRVREASHA